MTIEFVEKRLRGNSNIETSSFATLSPCETTGPICDVSEYRDPQIRESLVCLPLEDAVVASTLVIKVVQKMADLYYRRGLA